MKPFQLLLGLLLIGPFSYAGKPGYPNDAQARIEERPTYENCRNEKRATVVGSSVTLGFFGDSPSMLYLERAGFKSNCIQKKSFPIGDSEKHADWLKESVEEFKPEVIIALDYLIHDVTFVHDEDKVSERLDKSKEIIDYLQSLAIPVVIGTVFTPRPDQYPFQMVLAKSINQKLCAEALAAPKKFFVLPIARIYKQLYSDQFSIDGLDRTFAKEDILVDMYHPGPRGAYLLTSKMIKMLNELHSSEKAFPYEADNFGINAMLSKPKTRPILQSLNPMAHEKTLFTKHGEDTLELVGPNTIPDDLGDEACDSSL